MSNTLKGLDAFQVLRSVYDDNKNTLRVSILDGSSGGGSFEVVISQTDDSIRIGDGTNLITATSVSGKVGLDANIINAVTIIPTFNPNITGLNQYSEVTSVASGVETTIVAFTALTSRSTFLQKVTVSGDNIAEFAVKINGAIIDKTKSFFGNLNGIFLFDGQLNSGLELNPGDIVTVTALHSRPFLGSFNSKILYIEVT